MNLYRKVENKLKGCVGKFMVIWNLCGEIKLICLCELMKGTNKIIKIERFKLFDIKYIAIS